MKILKVKNNPDYIDFKTKNQLIKTKGFYSYNNIKYKIINSIPRFVNSSNYSDAFGLQWNKYRTTQLDSFTGTTISEDRLQNSISFPLDKLKGKLVLEVGSGAGRFTEVLLKYGATVYSSDYSNAVEANYKNNMPNKNLFLFQADLNNLPLDDNKFDLVIALGVIQHTKKSEESIMNLYKKVKVGGELSFDHYKYHLGLFTSLYLIYWFIIKRIKINFQHKVTEKLVDIFYPIHFMFRNNKIIQLLLRRISPINFYYGQYDLPLDILREWSILDTHDRNTDYYKHHTSYNGLKNIFIRNQIKNYSIEIGGTGYLCKVKNK